MSIKSLARNLLKTALLRRGFEISRMATSNSDAALTLTLFNLSGATTVIDVGANSGQFAEQLLRARPGTQITSFEPLSSAHTALLQKAAKIANWKIARRMALGSATTRTKINISANLASSSLRAMEAAHTNAAPESRYIGEEEVDVKRLDDAYAEIGDLDQKIYLKIDTQGFEAEVLEGSEGILGQVVALQMEGSLFELYTGQELASDLIRRAEKLGFKLHAILNGFRDPATRELLQVDLFFIRNASVPHSVNTRSAML
jgi:FkbM family methyltransferase